jgi:pimeloyl-ACP methyl ester carboxylesterase
LVASAADPALERPLALQHIAALPGLRHVLPAALRTANAELLALPGELMALQGVLGSLKCPIHIVHGTNDPLTPVGNVAFLQKNLSHNKELTIDIIKNANHFLPWNQAQHLRATLHGLLDKLA